MYVKMTNMEIAKVQIVDDNDQIIGHKERSEIDDKKDIYRVSSLWLTNSKQEVLLAQRKHTKANEPGKWGPAVAGTLEGDESFESNIIKEISEEIGLTNLNIKKGPYIRIKNPRNYFCQWYTASLDIPAEDITAQEEEVERVAWFNKKELKKQIKSDPSKFVASMPRIADLFL